MSTPKADERYIQQVEGKGLSTNDYTTDEKNKLDTLPTEFFDGNYENLDNLPDLSSVGAVIDLGSQSTKVDGLELWESGIYKFTVNSMPYLITVYKDTDGSVTQHWLEINTVTVLAFSRLYNGIEWTDYPTRLLTDFSPVEWQPNVVYLKK